MQCVKSAHMYRFMLVKKPNIKEFHAHSLILKTQSKFFNTEDIQKKDGYYILNLNNSPKVFEILLRYILYNF